MKLQRRRYLNVIATVDAVRAAHGDLLMVPMRVGQLERVLKAERISVLRLPIEETAWTIGGRGSYVIVVNSNLSGRHYSRVVAHEYAHIKLHRSPHEIEIERSACERGDPREYEAELFVTLLRLGPSATPDHADVARLVAKMEAAERQRVLPEQIPLPLAEHPRDADAVAGPPPVARPALRGAPQTPQAIAADYEDSLTYWRRYFRNKPKRPWTRVSPDAPLSDDMVRIKFYDEEKRASRFTDTDGRRWWIYNFRIVTDAHGRRRRVRVRDFMSRDIEYRVFVNALGHPRVYRFADRRESRDYRVKHLERQLAESKPIPTAGRPRLLHRPRVEHG